MAKIFCPKIFSILHKAKHSIDHQERKIRTYATNRDIIKQQNSSDLW